MSRSDRQPRFPLAVSAVLFDLDGTLLNTVPLIVASHRHALSLALAENEIPDDAWLRDTIGLPLEYVYDEAKFGSRTGELIKAFTDYNVSRMPYEVGVFRGVVPMLEGLRKKRILLGVVTAKRRAQALYGLDTFGLLPYFDVVVGKEDSKRHKPFADPLLAAMAKLGSGDVEHLLYIGDSVHDLEAAQAAGCFSAAVRWSLMPEHALEACRPTFWLEKAEQLPTLLQPRQFAIMAEEF